MSGWSRWLLCGVCLAALEAALVFATDRQLFLSWTELGRYGLLAMLLLPALCVAGGAAASGLASLLGRRIGWLAFGLTAPASAWVLWLLTEGRRVRELPGRVWGVALLALVAAWLARRATTLLWRHARDEAQPTAGRRAAYALACIAGLTLTLDMYVLRRLYPAFHWSLAGLTLALSLGAAALWPLERDALGRRARRGSRVGVAQALSVLLLCLGAGVGLGAVADAPNARFAIEQCAPLTGKALRLWPSAQRAPAPASLAFETAGVGEQSLARAAGLALASEDVLLITVDALRADRLRAYGGHGLTPAMDRLADESTVFLRAYTPTPHTSYALSSLMTGKFTREVLMLSEHPAGHPTLPGLLRQHGYRTAAFYPPAIFFVDGDRFGWLREDHLGFEYVKAMYAPASERVEQLAQYLRGADPARPLFAWVHLFEPHEPYEPPPGFARGDRPVERYDGEVAAVDAAVASLVEVFRRARPGATVVLTSDHGEEFGDHGGHHHGTTLFDEQLRVPLLWSSPGAAKARVVNVPVETIDITTTLLSALGVPREARMRGDDLSAILAGAPEPQGLIAFASIADSRMTTDGTLKLICEEGGGRCRLFDLHADPAETRDLSRERPEDFARLRARLDAMVASIPRYEALAMQGGGGWPEALARARLGDVSAAPDVVPLLASSREAVRAAAARAVGEFGVVSASNVVARMCESDSSETVRAEAAIAAVTLGQAAGVEHVRALLEQQGALARRAALALASAGHDAGNPVLLRAAGDASLDEQERLAAIAALAARGGPGEAMALLPLLDDVRLRAPVADALAQIGNPSVVADLRSHLDAERYPMARAALIRALIALGDRAAALRYARRYLGTASGLPDGVALLRDAGALSPPSGAGAELGSAAALRQGEWSCGERGCRPIGDGALALDGPGAPADPAQGVVRVFSEGGSLELRVGDVRQWVHPGSTEVTFAMPPVGSRRVAVSAPEGLWLEAVAVVNVQEDVPPPPPEPWQAESDAGGSRKSAPGD